MSKSLGTRFLSNQTLRACLLVFVFLKLVSVDFIGYLFLFVLANEDHIFYGSEERVCFLLELLS